MLTQYVARRTFAALVAGAWLATVASAEVIVHTATAGDLITSILPPDVATLTLPQYDGEAPLVRVKVEVEATLSSRLTAQNQSPAVEDISIQNDVPVLLTRSPVPGLALDDMLVNSAFFANVAPNETRMSGKLTANTSECFETGSTTCSVSANIDDVAGIFSGTGDLSFSFAVGAGNCTASGPPNVFEDCDALVQFRVTVTYENEEDCPKINRRRCASLLLFPEFDNRYGVRTIATVTNKNKSEEVCVHYLYIGRRGYNNYLLNCEEFDRLECLTPNDTLTVMTNYHNPQQEQGYFYAYAVDGDTHEPIIANDLIGHLLVVDGLDAFEYAVNPVDYRAILGPGDERGDSTDKDDDGIRDLNGVEYEKTACEILIPRFIGQGYGLNSKMIFIGLSGGSQFTTTADVLLYNDNEEAFSANHTFRCWDKVRLGNISMAFMNDFLKSTHDNKYEKLGPYEYGWIRITGRNAHSTFKDIENPAIYAVLIEIINEYAAADLPFERCHNKNGHLLPRTLGGDNEE